jgi:hypothetical protein
MNLHNSAGSNYFFILVKLISNGDQMIWEIRYGT